MMSYSNPITEFTILKTKYDSLKERYSNLKQRYADLKTAHQEVLCELADSQKEVDKLKQKNDGR